MMKWSAVVSAVIASAIVVAAAGSARCGAERPASDPMTTLTERDRAAIVRAVLEYEFAAAGRDRIKHHQSPRIVLLQPDHLRASWLPYIPGIAWVRMRGDAYPLAAKQAGRWECRWFRQIKPMTRGLFDKRVRVVFSETTTSSPTASGNTPFNSGFSEQYLIVYLNGKAEGWKVGMTGGAAT